MTERDNAIIAKVLASRVDGSIGPNETTEAKTFEPALRNAIIAVLKDVTPDEPPIPTTESEEWDLEDIIGAHNERARGIYVNYSFPSRVEDTDLVVDLRAGGFHKENGTIGQGYSVTVFGTQEVLEVRWDGEASLRSSDLVRRSPGGKLEPRWRKTPSSQEMRDYTTAVNGIALPSPQGSAVRVYESI